MKLEKTTTGLIIHNPDDMTKRKILQYFSLVNPVREFFIYSGNDTSKKPIFGKEHDTVYISSGFLNVNDNYIRNLPRPSVIHPITPAKIELTMNRQPRSRLQEDCIKKMIDPNRKSNKLTIELKPGTGKGHPYSTRIPTPTSQGYTLMGDLKVGDHVFDRLGQPTKVTDIFELGEIEVYKVTFQDGRISYCTGEHLWTVKSHKNGIWKTLMLKDMIDLIEDDEFFIPTNKPVEYGLKDNMLSWLNQYTNNGKNDSFMMGKYPNNEDNNKVIWFLRSLGYSTSVDGNYIYADKIDGLKMTSIEFSHMEKSRCIMVDNPEHLYLTEDFIVTHNTFIATYGISKLGLKPLIVAPTTLLKNQWCDEFEAVGIPRHDIATNIYDSPNKKLTVVTISSIENALRDDWEGLMNVINKSAFGIKVVDEAHLHLKGNLKFDAICNIRHNWYLSATLGRSDAQEDNILNRALSDADRFIGNPEYEEYQKQYVNVFYQDIYYYPSTKLCMDHFRYGSKGLIKATYYRMLMAYKDGIPFLNNLIHMMKVAKKTITYDGKILLLVPLISIIERVM